MLLCVDIGNTSATYAVFSGRRMRRRGYVPTSDFPYLISKLLSNRDRFPISNICISSVVPKITRKTIRIARSQKGIKLWIVGKNLKVSLRHNYKIINRLGSDRLVNAYGAIRLYGAPVLILDYGTALTCDFVSSQGVFMGGLIIAGPEIALRALHERTALLPAVRFPNRVRGFIGRDTQGCMKAGILQGYGAMTDGLIERFRRRYGKRFRVIATGGFAEALTPYSTRIDIVDPLLTLKSLCELYRNVARDTT